MSGESMAFVAAAMGAVLILVTLLVSPGSGPTEWLFTGGVFVVLLLAYFLGKSRGAGA